MINPQFKPADPKKSMKSLKKFLPQLSSMAKKEGLGIKGCSMFIKKIKKTNTNESFKFLIQN